MTNGTPVGSYNVIVHGRGEISLPGIETKRRRYVSFKDREIVVMPDYVAEKLVRGENPLYFLFDGNMADPVCLKKNGKLKVKREILDEIGCEPRRNNIFNVSSDGETITLRFVEARERARRD